MMNGPLNLQLTMYLVALVEHVRNKERVLDVNEAAYILNRSSRTIKRWCEARKITHRKFPSGEIGFLWEDIELFLQDIESPSIDEAARRRAEAARLQRREVAA